VDLQPQISTSEFQTRAIKIRNDKYNFYFYTWLMTVRKSLIINLEYFDLWGKTVILCDVILNIFKMKNFLKELIPYLKST
jgi:hypothetical protein